MKTKNCFFLASELFAIISLMVLAACSTNVKPKTDVAVTKEKNRTAPSTISISIYPPEPRYRIFIGDEDEWHVELTQTTATTLDGKHVKAQLLENGNILNLAFAGGGRGIAYIGSVEQDWNLTKYLKKRYYLNFDVSVQTPPTKKTEIHVESWYPILGSVNMTKRFNSLALNTTQSYSIDISCFENNGADFEKINILFWIGTDGEFSASFSNINWGDKVEKADVIHCS